MPVVRKVLRETPDVTSCHTSPPQGVQARFCKRRVLVLIITLELIPILVLKTETDHTNANENDTNATANTLLYQATPCCTACEYDVA